MLQTEHEFTLPYGLTTEDGSLYRDGTMRLATAADEILPMADPRVTRNPSYLTVILLSRVIRLDGIDQVTPRTIEQLFAADLAFLQDLYAQVNKLDDTPEICPSCGEEVRTGHDRLGEPRPIRSVS